MNPLGIETVTFRIVVQCLKQLRYILINCKMGGGEFIIFRLTEMCITVFTRPANSLCVTIDTFRS